MARPKSTARLFPSLAAASGATKIPAHILKAWKAKGCPAFLGSGRVDEKALMTYASEHKDEVEKYDPDTLPLKEQKTREEVRKLRLGNDLKERKLAPISEIIERFTRMANRQRAIIKKPKTEAALYAELPVHSLVERLTKMEDDVLLEIQKTADEFKGL
jgi:hypothetical protein